MILTNVVLWSTELKVKAECFYRTKNKCFKRHTSNSIHAATVQHVRTKICMWREQEEERIGWKLLCPYNNVHDTQLNSLY